MRDVDVMIVDGEDWATGVLAEFMRKNSRFRAVYVATSLADARQRITELRPHLLLLNNCLPDGDGIQLLKDIVCHDYPTSAIFLTSVSDRESCCKAIRYGAFDYIIKPVSSERLQQTLEHYLRFYDSQQDKPLQINQWHVDELFNLQSKDFRSKKHVKNIEEMTLQRVKEVFEDAPALQTAESVARAIGVSKTTARRYLEFCAETGFLATEISYGRIGRPERGYKKSGSFGFATCPDPMNYYGKYVLSA